MHARSIVLSAAAVAVLALAPSAQAKIAPAACPGAHALPTAANARTIRRATLCLLNRQRRRHHLARLHAHTTLTHASTTYARLMVRERFFAHVSPAGSTLTSRIGHTSYLHHTRAWTLGENLAWGTGAYATPAHIVTAWMHSPGHRRNILDPAFRDIGLGIATGAPVTADTATAAGATYVTDFGSRAR